MQNSVLHTCPLCGDQIEAGFAARSPGLSFIKPEKFEKFAFGDEDLSRAGLRKLFPWKAEYYRSYLCRSCKLYLVDYSQIYTRRQVNDFYKTV